MLNDGRRLNACSTAIGLAVAEIEILNKTESRRMIGDWLRPRGDINALAPLVSQGSSFYFEVGASL